MDAKRIAMSRGVIEALDEELAYQATLESQGRADTLDHGVAGQLVTLATYSRRAQDAWTNNAGTTPALHELRKIAGIAIRALEQYGCPRRERFAPEISLEDRVEDLEQGRG